MTPCHRAVDRPGLVAALCSGGPGPAESPGVEMRLGSCPVDAHPASGHPRGGASPSARSTERGAVRARSKPRAAGCPDAPHTRTMRLELTKRGDYAVRAMLALARSSDDGLLSARRIADAMAIPVRFLPQVLADLQRAALVEAAPGRSRRLPPGEAVGIDQPARRDRGRRGRQPAADVRAPRRPCGLDGHCDVHDVFFRGQEAMLTALAGTSLEALTAPR